jgi:hypothetical protein
MSAGGGELSSPPPADIAPLRVRDVVANAVSQ